jgi:hypothetical protein
MHSRFTECLETRIGMELQQHPRDGVHPGCSQSNCGLRSKARTCFTGAERHGLLVILPLIERWYEFAYTGIMSEQAKSCTRPSRV